MKKEKLYLLIAAGVIILLIFVIIIMGILMEIQPENQTFLNDVKNNLFTWGTLLIGFYWGTSTSSDKKTDMINANKDAG